MDLDRLLRQVLRGRVAVSFVLIAAPLAVLVVLGSLWLNEHGVFLPFAAGFLLAYATWRLVLWAILRRKRPAVSFRPLVQPNPEWTEAEQAAFARLSAEIAGRLAEPLPWRELQAEAWRLLERAAAEVSGGKRGPLDFSVPEVLLLADRVLGRLRGDLRRYVPLADQVRIGTLLWLWKQRQRIGAGVTLGKLGWRVFRITTNLPGALLQEAQALLLSPANAELQFAGQAGLQRVLLEEIAAAAIDLHGGYLRYTEAELLQIDLAATEADRARLAAQDQPLRVLVLGQISAGKSSLINALTGEVKAETDIAPTTPGLVTHPLDEGLSFIDTPGIDGSKVVEDQLLAEALQADLILWACRANRPARAPDVALLTRLRQACDEAGRRRPPVIVALTGVDLLLQGWPFAENLLPPEALARLSELIATISADLGESRLVPLCLEPTAWNLKALEGLIDANLPEALMVQRNRRRLQRTPPSAEIAKGLRGAGEVLRFAWGRWRHKR